MCSVPPCGEGNVCVVSGLQPRWTPGTYYELAEKQRPLPCWLWSPVWVHLSLSAGSLPVTMLVLTVIGVSEDFKNKCEILWDLIITAILKVTWTSVSLDLNWWNCYYTQTAENKRFGWSHIWSVLEFLTPSGMSSRLYWNNCLISSGHFYSLLNIFELV